MIFHFYILRMNKMEDINTFTRDFNQCNGYSDIELDEETKEMEMLNGMMSNMNYSPEAGESYKPFIFLNSTFKSKEHFIPTSERQKLVNEIRDNIQGHTNDHSECKIPSNYIEAQIWAVYAGMIRDIDFLEAYSETP
jgi:hypothetical protein